MPFWRNWSGLVTANPRRMEVVSSEAELQRIVGQGRRGRYAVRAVGSGHSFTPLCATGGLLVSFNELSGVSGTDSDGGEATVRAGTKISQLGASLFEAGLALENQGDVDFQSIAGAVATGTHGTGTRFGSLSTQVKAVRLVSASGEIFSCSATDSHELLKAAQVSLGVLGLVSELTLRVLPAYRLLERSWVADVGECLEQFSELDRCSRHAEFFWVPARDKCAVKALDVTDEEPRGHQPAERAPPGTVERYVLPERVDWSHRIFPSQRTVPFNEMEFAVAHASGPDCFREIRSLMLGRHRDVRWAVEYRTQKADDIYLSPAYMRDVVAISVHQGAGLAHEPFFRDVEAIFRNHGGRPHWGKLHWHSAGDLEALYPMWGRFQQIREQLDPDGRFLNAYLRRLLLGSDQAPS